MVKKVSDDDSFETALFSIKIIPIGFCAMVKNYFSQKLMKLLTYLNYYHFKVSKLGTIFDTFFDKE